MNGLHSAPCELHGRVAVVTGASRGLGRDVALALANCGADVVVAARSRPGLDETVGIIERETGRVALAVKTDVSLQVDVETLRAKTEAHFGTTTILINAAGIFGPLAPLSLTDPSEWIETIMINAVGPYLTCRAFVPGMRDLGWGRIVNVSSSASLYPPGPLDSAYSTSKAALNRMTRHLAAELGGTGVTANVLHPGSFKSAIWDEIGKQAALLDERAAEFRDWADIVDKTGGDPTSKAIELILELASPGSSATNGQFCWPRNALEQPLESW